MKTSIRHIATGTSYGALADDQHAFRAVKRAISKIEQQAGLGNQTPAIGAVLLFLTNGYAHQPQNAIRLAAAAAGTPAIHGACSASIFTEEEWLLDVEGAAAMVFPLDYCWQPAVLVSQHAEVDHHLLCLSSPNAANIAVNALSHPQFGSVVSDIYGHGPFSLWQSGRINEQEYCHLALLDKRPIAEQTKAMQTRIRYSLGRAPAVRPISPAMQINLSDGCRLLEVGQSPAMASMFRHVPANLIDIVHDQLSNIFVAVGNAPGKSSLQAGDFTLLHVSALDKDSQTVILSGKVKSGRHLFWAVRDRQYAQQAMKEKLNKEFEKFDADPQFGLLFPNISRGAEFYAGRDRDREIFIDTFPGVPTLGLYGYAEILSAENHQSGLHHFSTLYGIFS